jgi:hypothetical protein
LRKSLFQALEQRRVKEVSVNQSWEGVPEGQKRCEQQSWVEDHYCQAQATPDVSSANVVAILSELESEFAAENWLRSESKVLLQKIF